MGSACKTIDPAEKRGELPPTPPCCCYSFVRSADFWEPLQSNARAEVPLLSHGDCQSEPGICTEVPADFPLSLKGSFSFCCCLGPALSRAEHLPPFPFFCFGGFSSQRDSARLSSLIQVMQEALPGRSSFAISPMRPLGMTPALPCLLLLLLSLTASQRGHSSLPGSTRG